MQYPEKQIIELLRKVEKGPQHALKLTPAANSKMILVYCITHGLIVSDGGAMSLKNYRITSKGEKRLKRLSSGIDV